jgi:hypothetical protein
MLHMVGVVPTGYGADVAQQDLNDLRRDVHVLVDLLEPPDLLSAWLIADSLKPPTESKGGDQAAWHPQTAQHGRLYAGWGFAKRDGMKLVATKPKPAYQCAVRQRNGTEGRKPNANLDTAVTSTDTETWIRTNTKA